MLEGIIPPIVTPMHADESLDLARLRELIDLQLASGVHGIFVLGTTGEFYALDDAEKQLVMETAVAHCQGRCQVYAGTGAESTREVLRLTKIAETCGINGVSIITPYFIKPNQHELYSHFATIAESTNLDVVLYNNPATCGGVNIEPDTVAKLAKISNVIGIKDSSGDLQNTIELIKRTTEDQFSVFMGRDTLILAALMFGAHGAIPASCNIAPAFCVGIFENFRQGNFELAREFQDRLTPIRLALSLGTGNGAVKEALALLGESAGPNRRPITPLSAEKRLQLQEILKKSGVLS